jgi:hypothetical protein
VNNAIPLDMQIVLVGAFRYALGRSTYVVDSTCNVIEAMTPDMPTGQLSLIEREIEKAIKDKAAGMQMDVDRWLVCRAKVLVEIKQRATNGKH